MIVRDESKVIKRCIDSVRNIIDYWVIYDTGSEDNTKEIIREELKDISGELHESKWVNFGHNRTELVQTAKRKGDFLLLLDADMIAVISEGFKESLDKSIDAYHIQYSGELDYVQKLLVNGDLDWKYFGVTHEYINAENLNKPQLNVQRMHHLVLDHGLDGKHRHDKYNRDIQLLLDSLKEDPENSRDVFYLAQSYADANQPEEAIKWYTKRTEMGGWQEEIWQSYYKIGAMHQILGHDYDVILQSYMAAYGYGPHRAEPLYELARYCRINEKFNQGYMFAKQAYTIPYPEQDILFKQRKIYDYGIKDELGVCAYHTGRHRESFELCNELVNEKKIPETELERIEKNKISSRIASRAEISSSNKRIFIYDYWMHIPWWLNSFQTYLYEKGFSVCAANGPRFDDYFRYAVDGCSHVFMWNGNLECYERLKNICNEKNIPYSVLEVGWFPQNNYYHFDNEGINASSSMMRDNFDWISENHLKKLDRFKDEYLGERKYSGKNEYILCPLQLEDDTNIINHSPYSKMQDFIDHVENKFSDQKIIFKKHPKSKITNTVRNEKSSIIEEGDFLELAQDAELVYGINSTCLLESHMMDVPTESIGDGLLAAHKGNEKKLLAALVDKQIPINETKLDKWFGSLLSETLNNDSQVESKATIIVKTFERPKCAKRLIESVRRFYPNIRIIVVDDSKDPEELLDCDYIKMPFDSGLSAGRNLALSKVTTPYFVLLDDDLVFTEKTHLELWLQILENTPINIVAGNKGDCHFEGTFQLKNGVLTHVPGQSIGELYGVALFDIVNNFFMAETDTVKEIGGWDEKYKIGGEHGDFFMKAKQNKLLTGYCPAVWIDHKDERTEDYSQYRNRREFAQDWFAKYGAHTCITRDGSVVRASDNKRFDIIIQGMEFPGDSHREILPKILNRFLPRKNLIGAEIGVHKGECADSLLRNIDSLSLKCIDPWKKHDRYHDPINESSQEEYDQRFNDVIDKLSFYGDRVEVIRKYSTQVNIEKLDFVFIDGNHDYDNVLADLHHWYPQIKNGGMILGHDFGRASVQNALRDFFVAKKINRLLNYFNAGCWSFIKSE